MPEGIAVTGGTIALYTSQAPDKSTVNEDCCAVIPVNPETVVLAIADGAGGHDAGDKASKTVIKTLVLALKNLDEIPVRSAILNAIDAANAHICDKLHGAATTVAIAEITGNTARTYHVGDSGVCIVGGRGKLKMQTIHHSPTGYGVEAGLIGAEDALEHHERHLVSNLVGDEQMSVEIGSPLTLADRDTVILGSDGLYDNLYLEEIAHGAHKGPLASAAGLLVDSVNTRMDGDGGRGPGKPDDLTIMLYRRDRGPATRG